MGGVGTGWQTFVGLMVQLGHLKVAGDRKSPTKKIVKGKNHLEFMFRKINGITKPSIRYNHLETRLLDFYVK